MLNNIMRIDEVTDPIKDKEHWERYKKYLDKKEVEFARRRQELANKTAKEREAELIRKKAAGSVKSAVDWVKAIDQWAQTDMAKSTMR